MLGVTDIWTYVLGSFFIVLLPGPNSLYVLSTAARYGVKAGYRGAFGVFLGDTVLMALTAAGVASLLRTYPAVFMVVKYAGGAYLGYVGLMMAIGAIRRWRRPAAATPDPAVAEVETEAAATVIRPFRRALFISLLNPKAILFFISFFVQFVDPSYPYPVLSFTVLALILQLFSALYLSALIFGGTYLAGQFRRRRRLTAGLTAGVGAIFVGFGIRLATASLG